MSTPPVATLRVLCLHGFRTNIQVMEHQTQGLREVLGANTEFVYLNGPFEAEGKPIAAVERLFGHTQPFYEWMRYYLGDSTQSTILATDDIAVMHEMMEAGNKWPLRYGGIEQALEYLDEQLEALGPLDVVMGLSQGGIVLTVYAMWCLRKHNRRRWKLMVMASTPLVNAANVKHLFETPEGNAIRVPFPSVHLVGKADWIREDLISLMHMFEEHPAGAPTGRIMLEHEEGHRVPSFERHRAMYEELARVMNEYRERDVRPGDHAVSRL